MTSSEENASQIRTLGDDETYIAGASGGTVGASTWSYGVPCTELLLVSAVGAQTRRPTAKVNYYSSVDACK